MFTGLIEATGRIESVTATPGGRRLRVGTDLGRELRPGDSISVNGVCLTVVEAGPGGFAADVSPETLRVTTLQSIGRGRRVNLERPLRADARLGGHFVLGHVDGVGTVTRFDGEGDCCRLGVEIPASMRDWVIPKGSIAIDGVSLTVASLSGSHISVQLIPFTVEHTAFRTTQVGDAVNLEGDVLGKYVARLVETAAATGGRS
jgi:riboflavin synthase